MVSSEFTFFGGVFGDLIFWSLWDGRIFSKRFRYPSIVSENHWWPHSPPKEVFWFVVETGPGMKSLWWKLLPKSSTWLYTLFFAAFISNNSCPCPSQPKSQLSTIICLQILQGMTLVASVENVVRKVLLAENSSYSLRCSSCTTYHGFKHLLYVHQNPCRTAVSLMSSYFLGGSLIITWISRGGCFWPLVFVPVSLLVPPVWCEKHTTVAAASSSTGPIMW